MNSTEEQRNQDDHDLLIEIKTTVGIVLSRLEGFVTKAELQPILDREEHCRSQFKNFVTKQEFKPVRSLVYGAVGLTLFAVIGALLTLVVTKGS